MIFYSQNVVEWKFKVAENGNVQVKYKNLNIALKYSAGVLSCIPSLMLLLNISIWTAGEPSSICM